MREAPQRMSRDRPPLGPGLGGRKASLRAPRPCHVVLEQRVARAAAVTLNLPDTLLEGVCSIPTSAHTCLSQKTTDPCVPIRGPGGGRPCRGPAANTASCWSRPDAGKPSPRPGASGPSTAPLAGAHRGPAVRADRPCSVDGAACRGLLNPQEARRASHLRQPRAAAPRSYGC